MADDIVVLDAWPVVEYYKGLDPAASAVEELLADSDRRPIMSVVNFTEIFSAILVRVGTGAAERAGLHLRHLVVLESATSDLAETAARLKYTYRMALGDTYAVATALHHDAPVWTGDAEILCPDGVWKVNDLRDEITQQRHQQRQAVGTLDVGRRRVVAHLSNAQIAEFLVTPLPPSEALRASTAP